MKLDDLKAQQPGLLAEFKTEVLAEAQKGEADRQKKAVDDAIKAEREKKPTAATRAELKAIVPEGMAGREDLIGKLQDDNATAAEAQGAVVAKLTEENKAQAAKIEELQKTNKSLGVEGKGVNPVGFRPGENSGGEFATLVRSIAANDKCSIPVALAKAQQQNPELHRAWVNDNCPTIKAA